MTSRPVDQEGHCFLVEKNLNKLEQIVTAELQKISDRTNFNRLSLNANKSCHMIVPSKKYKNRASNFKLILCGNVIHQTDTVKYLGLHLQDNLKSNSQINYALKKVSQAAGIISKIRHFVNKKTLVMMYYSFVYCHLHYGILTWTNSSVSMLKPLKVMQNHILRLISFKKIKDKVNLNKLYASFNILKLEDIYNLELAKFVYLHHSNALPEIFKNYVLLSFIIIQLDMLLIKTFLSPECSLLRVNHQASILGHRYGITFPQTLGLCLMEDLKK